MVWKDERGNTHVGVREEPKKAARKATKPKE